LADSNGNLKNNEVYVKKRQLSNKNTNSVFSIGSGSTAKIPQKTLKINNCDVPSKKPKIQAAKDSFYDEAEDAEWAKQIVGNQKLKTEVKEVEKAKIADRKEAENMDRKEEEAAIVNRKEAKIADRKEEAKLADRKEEEAKNVEGKFFVVDQ
jgi:hypothetical protein